MALNQSAGDDHELQGKPGWEASGRVLLGGNAYGKLTNMSLGTVISLCDESGNMVQPWAEAGYECWCYDVKHLIRVPKKVGNIHFVWGDARTVRRPPGHIVAAFAFPPCTHIAGSGARDWVLKGGQMLRDTLEIFEACRQVCEWSGAPYAIENPVGGLSSIKHIGKPDYYFHPYEYTAFELGDNYTKKTCLWTGNGIVMPAASRVPDLPKPDDRIHKATPGEDRGEIRSKTPMGFARAVFEANAPHLKEKRDGQAPSGIYQRDRGGSQLRRSDQAFAGNVG